MKITSGLAALFLICLSGCAAEKPITVISRPAEAAAPQATPALPPPRPIKEYSVNWIVLTPPNTDEAFFCTSATGYQSLSRAQADTQRWVEQASGQLRYYRGENVLREAENGRQ